MDTAWVGVVGALAGVAVTGVLSLIGGQLTRRHDKSERRYEIRRDAYVAFDAAVARALAGIHDFVDEIGEWPRDRDFGKALPRDVRQPLSLVVLVGPDDVVEAARKMSKALEDHGYGHIQSVEANQVREEFVGAARKALGLT
jgi:hypothetical protein